MRTAGDGEGEHHMQGRGVVIVGILRYVGKHKPKIILLENVAGLVHRHRETLDKVVDVLTKFGYDVTWKLLNTKTHGATPQSRVRVYIVGIRRPATGGHPATGGQPATGGMVWPHPVPCPDLSTIFDLTPVIVDYSKYPVPPCCQTTHNNVMAGLTKVIEAAKSESVAVGSTVDPARKPVVLDVGGTRVQVGHNFSPCVTRRRGAAFAMFSLQHGRPLSIHELCRLQGLNSNEMNIAVTKPQMGALLGNGFTCTVVARVMAAAIQAAENRRDSDPRLEPDTYIGCMRGG